MNRFSWKAGLIFSVAFAAVCMTLYIVFGPNVDFTCRYTNPHALGCGTYNAIGVGINAYADFFLQFVAPECVGGAGPDSCIGPALLIMFGTYLVLGFTIGGFLFRKRVTQNTSQP